MDSVLILAFGVVLMLAVLISERARRTVISTAVLFLLAGFAIGEGGLGLVEVSAREEVVTRFAELALFAILFIDGAQLRLGDITSAWRLPGRALLVGMPLTLGGIAVAAHLILGMTWTEAFLVGAILAATDPVFVTARDDGRPGPGRRPRRR